MVKKTTKTVKVPESKAEEWDEYVEDNPEVDTVSHLIRLSVEKEMSGNYDIDRRRESDESGESEAASGEVLNRLQSIESAIEQNNERMAVLQRESYANKAVHNIQQIAYASLPTPPKEDGSELEPHEWATTVEEIVQQIGTDEITRQIESDVEDALSHLAETTGQVQRHIGGPDDQTYYFRPTER